MDVLTVVWGNGAVTAPVYLTEMSFGADNVIEVKGMSADEVVYIDSPTQGVGDGFLEQTVGTIEPATLQLMDLPALRDADDDFGFYYAMSGASDAWRGGALYRSLDGVTYEQIASADAPTPMGHATTVLADGPTTIHDDVNTVTVQMTYGELSSVTRDQSLNGANAALLGSELLTFDTATPVSDGVYTLSGLLRGRKGTEWATGSHAIGERFVLLSAGTIGRVADASSNRNAAVYYKGVSYGLTLTMAADQTFTDTAASRKPYSPVQIARVRDGSDNLAITWVRRARINAEWQDIDVPLDEPSEAYEVDVLDGVDVVRISTPAASYSAADQTSDFGAPQPSVGINVYQLSSRVGRGFAGSATI